MLEGDSGKDTICPKCKSKGIVPPLVRIKCTKDHSGELSS